MDNPSINETQLESPASLVGIGRPGVETIRESVLQSILKGRHEAPRTLQSQTEVHTDTESNTSNMR